MIWAYEFTSDDERAIEILNSMIINYKLGFYAFVTLPAGKETSRPIITESRS